MREVYQFWGYGPDAYDATVGDGRTFGMPTSKVPHLAFGKVRVAPPILDRLGPFAAVCAKGWWSWLLLDDAHRPAGHVLATLQTTDGRARPILTRTHENEYRFAFDLDETIRFIQNERYRSPAPPWYLKLGVTPDHLPDRARRIAMLVVHRLGGLRRSTGPPFPASPVDPAVDAWRYLVRSILDEQGMAAPIPLWPEGRHYACVLTHDIDTAYSLRRPRALAALRGIEEDHGLRSAWLIVSRLATDGLGALDHLHADGHEIGFHGSHHDHRLPFLARHRLRARIETARPLIERYGATGFRSPSFLRTPALFRALDGVLHYDMSMHDTTANPAGRRLAREGCSSCFPFFTDGTDVLEIPTTIPEDWTGDLAGIAPSDFLAHQRCVTQSIKARGGIANILTHPERCFSLREPWLDVYRSWIEQVAGDPSAWIVTPGTLNRHWRHRHRTIQALWAGERAQRRDRIVELIPAT